MRSHIDDLTALNYRYASCRTWRIRDRSVFALSTLHTSSTVPPPAQREFFTLVNLAVPGLLGEANAFNRRYQNPITAGQVGAPWGM